MCRLSLWLPRPAREATRAPVSAALLNFVADFVIGSLDGLPTLEGFQMSLFKQLGKDPPLSRHSASLRRVAAYEET